VDAAREAEAVVAMVRAKHVVQWAPAVRSCARAALQVTRVASQVATLRGMPVARSTAHHATMLDALWDRLRPGVPQPAEHVASDAAEGTPTWSDIGFQHPADPTADFRGMAAAGLHFLFHAVRDASTCTAMRDIIAATELPLKGYPIAASWMSVLNHAGQAQTPGGWACCLLTLPLPLPPGGNAVTLLNERRLDGVLAAVACRLALVDREAGNAAGGDITVETFWHVVCGMCLHFHHHWQSRPGVLNVMHFPGVFKEFSAQSHASLPGTWAGVSAWRRLQDLTVLAAHPLLATGGGGDAAPSRAATIRTVHVASRLVAGVDGAPSSGAVEATTVNPLAAATSHKRGV